MLVIVYLHVRKLKITEILFNFEVKQKIVLEVMMALTTF